MTLIFSWQKMCNLNLCDPFLGKNVTKSISMFEFIGNKSCITVEVFLIIRMFAYFCCCFQSEMFEDCLRGLETNTSSVIFRMKNIFPNNRPSDGLGKLVSPDFFLYGENVCGVFRGLETNMCSIIFRMSGLQQSPLWDT